MYRLLLEPADIANHYGLKAFAANGHYLEGNRAGRSGIDRSSAACVLNHSYSSEML